MAEHRAEHAGDLWLAEVPDLPVARESWARDLRVARDRLDAAAARWIQPAAPSPARAARFAVALQVAELRMTAGLLTQRLFGLPQWPRRDTLIRLAGVTATGQIHAILSALGPLGAELGRTLALANGLLPGLALTSPSSLLGRPMSAVTAERRATTALGPGISITGEACARTPTWQLHPAEADGVPVLLRVSRTEARAQLEADLGVVAGALAAASLTSPHIRRLRPDDFLRLIARQAIEEGDLRNDALNATELGLALHALGLETPTILRPLPGFTAGSAVAFEAPGATAPLRALNPDRAASALVAVTVESALGTGVYHGDPRIEHLAARDDGSVAIVGCTHLGTLSPATRKGILTLLIGIAGNDPAKIALALEQMGALTDDADVPALLAVLRESELLGIKVLLGGDATMLPAAAALANAALAHGIRPTTELLAFVRSLATLRVELARLSPDLTLTKAIFGILPRLPALAAQIEQA